MKRFQSQTGTFVRGQILTSMTVLAVLLFAVGCQSTNTESTATGSDAIFDEQTSGKSLVNAALARAKTEHKDVVLLFGANWCPYCRQLHKLLESNPAVHEVVNRSFIVVPIDVGTSSRNRNTDIIDRYDSNVFTDGTPSVVILDAEGKRLAPTKSNPWSAKNPIEEARVLAFLKDALNQ